ncbi:hypothetical protein ACFQBQ_07875 [Granulicella cerasi]|uniref:Phage head morphogenesis domain-containing protein n=1 Tax=Granulicella cerasi TaxID=741063 RepID=A0ABW1Z9W6_9BACT|nr:hypothetical protein [Granulicella cerasi]
MPKKHVEAIYQAALRSVSAGKDLHLLSNALMEIAGMTRGQAGQVALSLNDKATAMIEQERRGSLGITHAIWMYAAPCMNDPRNPSESDMQRDAAHRAANGKKYETSKGMYLNGKWTRPRVEDGCKCVSRSVMPWS